MRDVLLEIAQNKNARKLIQSLGLPIPLPERLKRDEAPWTQAPLRDYTVIVGATAPSEALPVLAECLTRAGANAYLSGPSELTAAFAEPGEAFGRPARTLEELSETASAEALVFDASAITTVAGLRAVYDFFHPLVGRIKRSGRAIVIGRSAEGAEPEAAAAASALDGFVRSLAKEVGKRGATANLIAVDKGAEARLAPVVRFVLSARSAFISGQPFVVSTTAKTAGEPAYVRPLEKKIVLVTGAARGIGAATARLFAQEGAHVVCLDRPADDGPLSQLARELGGTPVALDIAAPDAAIKLADALKEKGGVDVIVHNAGITRDKTLARMKSELWDQTLDINLQAVVRTTRALEGVLRDGGRIICLSSIAGLAGNVGQTNYAASKAGVAGFVRALAPRLASRGITVNAIAPGFIETRLTAAIPVAIREVGRRLSALGQGGQPEDVGQAIVFLASPGAQGLTGRVLRVCGGAFIGA